MPYINKKVRKDYDEQTLRWIRTAFVSRAKSGVSNNSNFAGDMNWLISSILYEVFDANPSYRLGNDIMGLLECAKQEFYRRKLAPYEDLKIKENGDL